MFLDIVDNCISLLLHLLRHLLTFPLALAVRDIFDSTAKDTLLDAWNVLYLIRVIAHILRN